MARLPRVLDFFRTPPGAAARTSRGAYQFRTTAFRERVFHGKAGDTSGGRRPAGPAGGGAGSPAQVRSRIQSATCGFRRIGARYSEQAEAARRPRRALLGRPADATYDGRRVLGEGHRAVSAR